MDRSAIRLQAADWAGDPNTTRFSPTQYNTAINRAQEEFAFDSKALFRDAPTYTVVAGTAEYALPSDFWLEKYVTHKGIRLDPVSIGSLLYECGDDWSDDEGTPTKYLIRPQEDNKVLRLYRIPQAEDAGANLILTYYPVPAALSADSDIPLNSSALMVQFHMGIAAKAAVNLLLCGEIDASVQSKMQSLSKIYWGKVAEAQATFGDTKSEPWRIRGCKG